MENNYILTNKVIDATNVIRKKYKALNQNKHAVEKQWEKTFKTITTPLSKIEEKIQPLKKEIINADNSFLNKSNDLLETDINSDDDNDDETLTDPNAKISQEYFTLVTNSHKLIDTTYGVYFDNVENNFKIGNLPLKIIQNQFDINGKMYDATPGLYELLFFKLPNKSMYTESDLVNYGQILKESNAYRRDFDANQQIKGGSGSKYNKIIKPLINHHTLERFNKTLKNNMWKEFSLNGSYRWIDMIYHLLEIYNNTKHRKIKMKPSSVNWDNERDLYRKIYHFSEPQVSAKFQVGDPVRISKYKHLFEKGYTPNYTTEIFKISKIQHTDPATYLLEDSLQNPIKGGFYEKELLKVENPDIYLIEKILRRKGNRLYVKWLGLSAEHHSWINKNDVL